MNEGPHPQVSRQPPTHPPRLPRPAVVSQDELRQLQEWQRRRRQAERLRNSILDRLNAGADIESGTLTIEIEEKPVRQISRTALEGLWGAEYVERLRHHIPETVQRHVRVIDQSTQMDM